MLIAVVTEAAHTRATIAAVDPTAAMNTIEAGLVMPAGARPLANFHRTYALFPPNRNYPHGYIRGMLLDANGAKREWVEPDRLQIVVDGSCGVVTVVADALTLKVLEASCGGLGVEP